MYHATAVYAPLLALVCLTLLGMPIHGFLSLTRVIVVMTEITVLSLEEVL